MLILTRKKDERIIIKDNIKITVIEISENFIKLGIDAPESVTILREEIIEEAKSNK